MRPEAVVRDLNGDPRSDDRNSDPKRATIRGRGASIDASGKRQSSVLPK